LRNANKAFFGTYPTENRVRFPMPNDEKAKHIASCLELALLLEVSASKPGNVNLAAGFKGTRVEHFLASAVASEPSFEKAARRGIAVSEEKLTIRDVGIGQLIKDCAVDINAWQKGGNTLLGTVILLVPIAVAAGITSAERKFDIDFSKLRRNLRLVVEFTTPIDAVRLYEAIDVAKPSGLGGVSNLDVNDPTAQTRILKDKISLYEVFKIAASYDNICSEWVNNYPITFDLAYPYLMEHLEYESLNEAIVHTFLKILSEHPDTFVARKVGSEKAQEISSEAKLILELGGLRTLKGKTRVIGFDRKLREAGNLLNPGTTADMTAATLALCTLGGFRP
jgi:triphosphoribosyl-dephospho-CoA synthase